MVRKHGVVSALRALALMVLVGLCQCGEPCRTLAENICSCEPGQVAQRSCVARLDAGAGAVDPNDAQQRVCQELLDADQCTCEALAAGDLVSCGQAKK